MKILLLEDVDDCIAFAQAINPKKEPLTIEKLKTFPWCEHYSDEEAARIVQTIHQLTPILFECTTQEQPCDTPVKLYL